MNSWHYATQDGQVGPLAFDEFEGLIASGIITSDTLVWQPEFADWKKASEALPSKFPPSPPPLPSSASTVASLSNAEETGPFNAADVRMLTTSSLAGPWPRFWARCIDTWLLAPLLGFAVALAAVLHSPATYLKLMQLDTTIFGLIILPIAGLVQAASLAVIGTTPGKAILGLKVRVVSNGNKLVFFLAREMKVWMFGLAFGFPIVALFTQVYQYRRVSAGRPAGYDDGYAIVEGRPSRTRQAIAALISVALILGIVFLQVLDRSSDYATQRSWDWVNPITNRTASVPGSWTVEELKVNSGRTFYFQSTSLFGEAIFGHEVINVAGIDANTYADAIKGVISNTANLTTDWSPIFLNGRSALRATGMAVKQADTYVEAIILFDGHDAWRVILFSVGRSTNELPGRNALLNALLSTAN